jgi:hypothetical protein
LNQIKNDKTSNSNELLLLENKIGALEQTIAELTLKNDHQRDQLESSHHLRETLSNLEKRNQTLLTENFEIKNYENNFRTNLELKESQLKAATFKIEYYKMLQRLF